VHDVDVERWARRQKEKLAEVRDVDFWEGADGFPQFFEEEASTVVASGREPDSDEVHEEGVWSCLERLALDEGHLSENSMSGFEPPSPGVGSSNGPSTIVSGAEKAVGRESCRSEGETVMV